MIAFISGIGRAIAEKTLCEGAEVVGFDVVSHPSYRHITKLQAYHQLSGD